MAVNEYSQRLVLLNFHMTNVQMCTAGGHAVCCHHGDVVVVVEGGGGDSMLEGCRLAACMWADTTTCVCSVSCSTS